MCLDGPDFKKTFSGKCLTVLGKRFGLPKILLDDQYLVLVGTHSALKNHSEIFTSPCTGSVQKLVVHLSYT